MKRLYLVIVVMMIAISLLTLFVAGALSAGRRSEEQEYGIEALAPDVPAPTILYVKPSGSGDCSTWTKACELPDALQKAVSGDEIWVAEGNYKPAKGLPLGEMSDFTFVAWVYFDGGGNWQRIFDFGQNTTVNMFLTPQNFGGIVSFAITTAGNLNEQRLNSPAPLPTGQWVHVAVTLAGDTGRLYIDGSEVVSNTITLDPKDVAGENVWLGESQYPADPTFDGRLDEVAIFDRALSGTEINNVISSGWDGLADQVLGLHMEENPAGDFTPIYDSSGLWNDGILLTDDFANKSITGTVDLALDFDGLDDYVDLAAEREGSFRLKSGVDLYGGFSGGETGRDQREWQNNVTVLSGDIDENDITDAYGVITGTHNISGTNACHVVTSQELTAMPVLDGFTITGGKADYNTCWPYYGGGLYDYHGAPWVENVTFSGNWGDTGGGIYSENSELTLINVTISGNAALEEGGGLYAKSSDPYLLNCTVSNNSAFAGGGIWNESSTKLVLDESMIGPGNNVALAGGGIANKGSLRIYNSTIAGNSGTGTLGGAGIYNSNVLSMTNSTVSDNVTIGFGGGILVDGSSASTITFSTITGNLADKDNNGGGGGGIGQLGSSPIVELKNSIVAGNALGGNAATGPDLSGTFSSLGYNLIGNSDGSAGFVDGVNNDQVGSDLSPIYPLLGPLALNWPGSTPTHALLTGSPAIDWIPGLVNGCHAVISADQRGVSRPLDGDNDGLAACDIGAFEREVPLFLPVILK